MIYVLFRNKGRGGNDYREFQNEKQATKFLVDNIKDIYVHKIIVGLAELKFGLSAIDPTEMKLFDTSKEAKAAKVEKEKAADYLPEEIPEEEQEKSDEEIIKENKEALDHADKAIAAAADDMKEDKTYKWKICPKCKINKVAPWNKKGICSSCQRRPANKTKYKKRKKSKID